MFRSFSILLVMLLLAASPVSADLSKEDVLKLALVYKIARFVTWPSGSVDGEFHLCIAGSETVATARERLAGRNVGNWPLTIREITTEEDAKNCQAIYITEAEYRRASGWLERYADEPVLTLSDASGFAESDGVVGLVRRNNRIGMQINLTASQNAGLEINSQLLQLAEVVKPAREDKG